MAAMSQTRATNPNRLLLPEQIALLSFIAVQDLGDLFVFHKPGLTAQSAKGYVSHFSMVCAKHEGFSLRDYFLQAGLDKKYSPDEMICFGRLDKDTSGLLVLAKRNQHPKFIDQVLLNPYFSQAGAKVTKFYRAQIKGLIDAERLNKTQKIKIPTKNETLVEVCVESARVLSFSDPEKELASSCVEIEINEGIHHQVKKIFYALGHPVRKGGLHRTRFGELTLATDAGGAFTEMGVGAIRPLFDAEKKWLADLYNGWLSREKKRFGGA